MQSHGHGGVGWELGRCLWSPSSDIDGRDRYSIMREPRPGDHVFHMVAGVSSSRPRDRYLFGRSLVSSAVRELATEPPNAGAWAGRPSYYRIELSGYVEAADKVAMDDVERVLHELILDELADRPKYYPYAPYRDGFRGAQGIYLTKLTPALAAALDEVVPQAGHTATANPLAAVFEFAEGERSSREVSFFKRNPALRAAAILKHGTRCYSCGLSFEELYGDLGAGFIEVHHLRPFAERNDSKEGAIKSTKVEDLLPLCPNCHRMVHRQKPALHPEDLRELLIARAAATGQG